MIRFWQTENGQTGLTQAGRTAYWWVTSMILSYGSMGLLKQSSRFFSDADTISLMVSPVVVWAFCILMCYNCAMEGT